MTILVTCLSLLGQWSTNLYWYFLVARFPRLVASWLTIAVMLTLVILICVVCIIIYRMAMNIALSTMGNDSQVILTSL